MSTRPWSPLAALSLSLLASCAMQKAATRESNGISVAVAPEAKCNHRGAKPTALPDAELCADVLGALGKALTNAGFTVASSPSSLSLHVLATQDTDAGDTPALSVEVRVRRGQEEVDVVDAQAEDLTAAGAQAKIETLLGSLANDLADSPRIKSSVASAH
jgi:hypothetical protein